MKRITKMGVIAALPAVAISTQVAQAATTGELKKPNVIFYMIEDTSPQYMAIYNDGKGAKTPNLEKLSKEMITYTNAFSNAPVSSAARTTLITGCYAPRFGGSLHRRLEPLQMPEGLRMFPSYLREAGYYTVNAQKTDYNVVLDETAWDKINGKLGGWRERKDPSQPFFMQRTNNTSHESRLLFDEEKYKTIKTETDPNSVYVHPNLPATDLMKYTYATFYDRINDTDKEFGQMLDMLRKDGLMDDTFIFFFGDNGGCVPESKGYTNDVGFRVPLLVYVPAKWREVIGVEVGKQCDAIVSFMDFGATALNLAGLEIPEQSDGRPFLGKDAKPGRESQICYGDRFDELYAFNRALYEGDFRYARNYVPYHTRGLHSDYRYKSLAFREARDMFRANKLNAAQSTFFQPLGAEDLYDLKNDPNELKNLAKDPKYSSVLKRMRAEMASQLDAYCDLGFLPETIIQEEAMKDPAAYGKQHAKELATYRKTADLQVEKLSPKVLKSLMVAMNSDDPIEKWWGLTSTASFGTDIAPFDEVVKCAESIAKSGERSLVRSRAFVALSCLGKNQLTSGDIRDMLAKARTLGETLLILNDLAYMYESGALPKIELKASDFKFTDRGVTDRMAYLNGDK